MSGVVPVCKLRGNGQSAATGRAVRFNNVTNSTRACEGSMNGGSDAVLT